LDFKEIAMDDLTRTKLLEKGSDTDFYDLKEHWSIIPKMSVKLSDVESCLLMDGREEMRRLDKQDSTQGRAVMRTQIIKSANSKVISIVRVESHSRLRPLIDVFNIDSKPVFRAICCFDPTELMSNARDGNCLDECLCCLGFCWLTIPTIFWLTFKFTIFIILLILFLLDLPFRVLGKSSFKSGVISIRAIEEIEGKIVVRGESSMYIMNQMMKKEGFLLFSANFEPWCDKDKIPKVNNVDGHDIVELAILDYRPEVELC